MKFICIFFAFSFLATHECGKHKNKTTGQAQETTTGFEKIPVCIQKKINSIKKELRWNPPAQVDEYIYNNQHVFLFSADCCDQFDMLYDDHCRTICAPSGGFTGRGDGKCADFLKTAQHVKIVWKDSR